MKYWQHNLADLSLNPNYYEMDYKESTYFVSELDNDSALREYIKDLYLRKLCYIRYVVLSNDIIGMTLYAYACVDNFSFDVIMSGIHETLEFVCKIPFGSLLNANLDELNEADRQRNKRRVVDDEEELYSRIKRRKLTHLDD